MLGPGTDFSHAALENVVGFRSYVYRTTTPNRNETHKNAKKKKARRNQPSVCAHPSACKSQRSRMVQLHTKSIRGLYTPRLLQNVGCVASTIHMLLTWVFTTTRRGFASFVRQFFTPPTSHIRLSRRQQHGTRSRPPQPAPVCARK